MTFRINVPIASAIIWALTFAPIVTARAADPTPAHAQAYIEATVLQGKHIVAQPHLLVTLGKDGAVTFASTPKSQHRIGLKFRVDPTKTGFSAAFSGTVDGTAVADKTLSFSDTQGAQATFTGGGTTWQIQIDLATPEFMQRYRAEHPPAVPPAT